MRSAAVSLKGQENPAAGVRPDVAAFLRRLPSLALSDTGRRNVCARFGLSVAELAAALAVAGRRQKGAPARC